MAVLRLCLYRARLERLVGATPACARTHAGTARHRDDGLGSMTPRRKRLYVVLAILGGVAASVSLAVVASRQNIMFYYDPSQVAAGQAPADKRFRIGGMVVKGSVARNPGDLTVRFVLTDFAHQIPVEYSGVLPDLFREGQGIIAHGTLGANGAFVADEVLAKHDEKYMPPEVAASLKQKAGAAAGAGGAPAGAPADVSGSAAAKPTG
jgi:cytochrome c-type biogenesis protein CcmE